MSAEAAYPIVANYNHFPTYSDHIDRLLLIADERRAAGDSFSVVDQSLEEVLSPDSSQDLREAVAFARADNGALANEHRRGGQAL